MPAKTPLIPVGDLFDIAIKELDKSVTKPNILNYGEKPYPEQMRFHKSKKRGRFISGSNRGGKTDAEVVEAIWWASGSHPYLKRPERWGRGPLQLRIVVVDIAKGIEQIMLPKFKRWMPRSMLIDGRWDKSWDSKNLILTFSNGSTIDFLTYGMELDKHGGVPRHIIFFDEEPPRDVFNESMARLIDYNGLWVIAATPVKGMGWTYDLLWEPAQNDPDGEVDTFVLTAADNPYIDAEAKDFDFYMQGMDKNEREMREHGSFVARSGLVFPNFSLETHVIDSDDFDMSRIRNWARYSSTDHGWNNPTAWLWHAVSPGGDIVSFAEHYKSEMTISEHARVVHEREAAWGFVPEIRVGDPAMKQHQGVTGTSYLQEYALNGLYINVEGIPHEVMIGLEKMQQYFRVRDDTIWGPRHPKWIILSNCTNFIRELKKLRWATYTSDRLAYEMNKQETVHKKDDHAFDSARYFATLMPDLSPVPDELSSADKIPTTISYQDMMVKMANDENVHFVDNEESNESEWETTNSFGDLYEGAY